MKLIVTGSRNWTDEAWIQHHLWKYTHEYMYPISYSQWNVKNPETVTLVHGACSAGADAIADDWARVREADALIVLRYPADWSQGKKAGPERNRRMIDENLDADYVLAFPLGESRGTRHCMNYAASKGLTVINLGER